MRLTKFLLENTKEIVNAQEIKSILENECSDFLKLLPKDKLLYRAENRQLFSGVISKITPMKNRNKSELYNWADEYLVRNNICISRLHNVIFCSAEPMAIFGSIRAVFPIGKFSYSFIKAKDFNMIDKETGWIPEFAPFCIRDIIYSQPDNDWKFNYAKDRTEIVPLEELNKKSSTTKILVPVWNGIKPEKRAQQIKVLLKGSQNISNWFSNNKDFSTALENKWEIWINCNAYYSVDKQIAKEIYG